MRAHTQTHTLSGWKSIACFLENTCVRSHTMVRNYHCASFSFFSPLKNRNERRWRFIFGRTPKLFLELRIMRIYVCALASHRDTRVLHICLHCAVNIPATGLLRCCLCARALCLSLIKYPHRGIHHLYQAEKAEITSPSIIVFDRALLLSFCVFLPPLLPRIQAFLFSLFSSGPPWLECREVICLYVRAVLSLSCLAPSKPSGLLIIFQISERLKFVYFCVCAFSFRSGHSHPCMVLPVLLWLHPSFTAIHKKWALEESFPPHQKENWTV